MAKILIAYYSRKGPNYVNGNIVDLPRGNTELAAEFIQKAVGGDLFEIDTVKTYPVDYIECTIVAKEELRSKVRPELKRLPENMDVYDTVFLGYPCWWGTMPMGVYTFLESFNFSGKTIVPFCTNEGSGMGGSELQIRKTAKEAILLKGLSIRGADTAASEAKIAKWAKEAVKDV